MTLTFKVAGIIETIATKAGLNAGTDGVEGDCYGVAISQGTYTQFLSKHKQVYNYLIVDDIINGAPMIRLVSRAVNNDIYVDFPDLKETDCVPLIEDQPAIIYNRVDPMNLPREVELQYISFNRAFAMNTQYARKLGARTQQNTLSVAVDFVLDDQVARELAYDLLFRTWSQQLSIKFQHPDITIEPSDIIQMATNQGVFIFQILTSMITKEPMDTSAQGRLNQLTAQLLLTRKGVTIAPGQINQNNSTSTFHISAGATVAGVGGKDVSKTVPMSTPQVLALGRKVIRAKTVNLNTPQSVTVIKT